METKQLTVAELKKNPSEVRMFMYDFFDFLINNYKIQSISEWERNQNQSDEVWREKIKELITIKNGLTDELKEISDKSDELVVKLGLEIEYKNSNVLTEHMKVGA